MPIEILLFGATLLGVAVFHHHTLRVATAGLAALAAWRLVHGLDPLEHLAHHGGGLLNLFGLLVGFAAVADHFERSGVPALLPRWLPDDWRGPFALAGAVFLLSSFLDNIAAAMIGAAVANSVFRGRVHVGYAATLVAAANAGGSGSVIGDTTTTMLWMAGEQPIALLPAYIAAIPAFLVTGVLGSRQQDRHERIVKDAPAESRIDPARLVVVGAVLAVLVAANVLLTNLAPAASERWPLLALALWAALAIAAALRRPSVAAVRDGAWNSLFLVVLVLAASLVPVDALPAPSAASTLGVGALSAVFDNIPLTALAVRQGGYDVGLLAFAVGFGGSMTWFGSSAGVAVCAELPEARNVVAWVRHGWHVPLAYVAGFGTLLLVRGWRP